MNCPFHVTIFKARQRSYRELPLRMFEFGSVYRYEKSGVVQGLTRVRGMTQDDAHIFCTRDQMAEELTRTLKFVLDLLRDFGLNRLLPRALDPPAGKGRRERRGVGRGGVDSCEGRPVGRARVRDGPGRRRVLRSQDLGAGA